MLIACHAWDLCILCIVKMKCYLVQRSFERGVWPVLLCSLSMILSCNHWQCTWFTMIFEYMCRIARNMDAPPFDFLPCACTRCSFSHSSCVMFSVETLWILLGSVSLLCRAFPKDTELSGWSVYDFHEEFARQQVLTLLPVFSVQSRFDASLFSRVVDSCRYLT